MDQLKSMKEMLVGVVQGQFSNLHSADYEELGAAIDMIKDLAEASYYCAVIEAMEGQEKQSKKHYEEEYRDYDRAQGKMYYTERPTYYTDGSGSHGSMYYTEQPQIRMNMRDSREGRSPMTRKMYMESKELHHPKETKLKELEKYMQELTQDLSEMISDASPEEKTMLQQKLSTLASKI